jgi:hypothetical protein
VAESAATEVVDEVIRHLRGVADGECRNQAACGRVETRHRLP